MNYLLALVLVSLTTAPVLDSLRRKSIFVRPEFYLLFAVYLYGTFGYITHLFYSEEDFTFIIPTANLSVHTSYLYASCAIFAIYVGGRFYKHQELEYRIVYSSYPSLAVIAGSCCALALAFNLYYFYTFGLFSGNFDRVVFIDEFKLVDGPKVPYLSPLYASLPILTLYERRPASWLVLLTFALLHLPVGNRRIVLAAMIILVTAKLLRGNRFGKKTLLAVLAVILIVGIIVGDVRGEGLSALSGIDFRRIFLALSEFSRPFVTLLFYVDEGYTPLYGTGLIQTSANVIPGSLWPFERVPSPSQQFVQTVDALGIYQGRVSGYGFYPVTEALLNFGPFGIPVSFLLLTLLVRKLSSVAVFWSFSFVVPVLCAVMFSFGRNPFSGMLGSSVWIVILGAGIHFAAALLMKVAPDVKRTSSRS